MSEPRLLPCPWCGECDLRVKGNQMECRTCGAEGPTHRSPGGAWDARRADPLAGIDEAKVRHAVSKACAYAPGIADFYGVAANAALREIRRQIGGAT